MKNSRSSGPFIEQLENRQLCSVFLNGAQSYGGGTFANSSWKIIPVTSGGGGTCTATQKTGGNPGTYRSITTTVNGSTGGSELWAFQENVAAKYNPAAKGAITSISYHEDSKLFSGFGEGQRTGPALEQNGVIYFMMTQVLDTTSTHWTKQSVVNLTAADFSPLGDPTAHPDFSQTGALIQFGIYRANSAGSSGYTIVAGVDNWLLTLKTRKQIG